MKQKPTFSIAAALLFTATALAWTGVKAGIAVPVASVQEPQAAATLSAGPVYTSKDGQDGPKFPRLDIVVRLHQANGEPKPPEPADLSLDSGSTALGNGLSQRSFGDAGYGVRSILALDLSGSMTGAPLLAIRTTISHFVNQARPQDQVEVLSFANDTHVEVPFGADQATLAARLEGVEGRGTETHLYDALLDALAKLDGTPACHQLTVISDGHDEGSKHTIYDVIAQAVRDRVPIDSIGLTRSHPEYLQNLARISQASGGNYALAQTPQELDGLIGNGIQAMRANPVVVFQADNLSGDGNTHNLKVRWDVQQLYAETEVQTPEITSPFAIWLWVLAGCFVAGLILLFVSRRQSRRAPPRPVHAVELAQQAPPQPPPVVHRSGATVIEEDKPASPPPPPRVYQPTVVELEPFLEPFLEPPPEPLPEPPPVPIPERPRPAPAHAKTRMAAFFDIETNCPNLEAIAGPLSGQSFPVSGEFLIGAVDGNDLVISGDPTLSGFHARVLLADKVLTIEDSDSTNGTFVNGVRLGEDRKLLKPGDEVRMGQSVFTVRTG